MDNLKALWATWYHNARLPSFPFPFTSSNRYHLRISHTQEKLTAIIPTVEDGVVVTTKTKIKRSKDV